MIVWGISGQIGAGKSTLAEIIAESGAVNLELDSLGHMLLDDPHIKGRLVATFGREILDESARVSRKNLGRLAFSTEANKDKLDQIMHPSMRAEVEFLLEKYRQAGTRVLIINAALLYKMGLDRFCSRIIFVRASEADRLQRIITLRGISPAAARMRLNAQDPQPERDPRVIFCDNDGTLESLREWVQTRVLPLLAATP